MHKEVLIIELTRLLPQFVVNFSCRLNSPQQRFISVLKPRLHQRFSYIGTEFVPPFLLFFCL